MIKGLYSASSGMVAGWAYQQVASNNLANAQTVGYKREVVVQESFEDVLLSQRKPVPAPLSAQVVGIIGQVGTGTGIAEFGTDYAQGALQPAGGELDFALTNGFFVVETPDRGLFYTRDGRFGRDANGDLVTSHGYYVLDADGDRIRLPAGDVEVSADAVISVDGEQVAALWLVDFAPNQLRRAGPAYFQADEPGVAVESPGLRQGFLEASNVQVSDDLVTLMTVLRMYQVNQAVMAQLNDTLVQATGTVGSVGG